MLRMGKALRLPESGYAAQTYRELEIPIVGAIEAPGTVDGGDCLWLDESTLAVGRGYRTNREGIRQLRAIMAGIGVEVLSFDLPHGNGPDECLHLMSLISPVAENLAVVYPPMMAVAFVELLRERGWRFVEVPTEEMASLGCNVLALAPGVCLLNAGNPVVSAKLRAEGCEVLTYEGSEISVNREGGPTCLTRPILRAV